ncbi:MAG TPA: ABC transporter substrate-binding protein, partial [Gemmatimonadaceae bacterium]|nr:ABC transporter substrate-binding protein [Gemmatimonadaceae bacterium]
MLKFGGVIFVAFFFVACSDTATDSPGDAGGTIVVLTTQDPGTLFPPISTTSTARQISEQIYDYLADVGPDLDTRNERGYRAELARSWDWSTDSLQLSFHVDPRARWHDGQPATARDVAFTFALNRNPQLASRYASSLENIDSVTVSDSLTAKFWFHQRRPSEFLDAAAQLPILPAHQLKDVPVATLRASPPPPVGTGRFRFRKWTKGESVEIVADTANYRGRAKVDRVIWSIVPEFTGALARLWRGDADVLDGLRPSDLAELSRHRALRVLVRPGMDYVFMRFNLRDPADTSKPHPLFKDRELRRAITMATDRRALARNLLDTFATVPVGPTVRAYPTTDPALFQLPFDSLRAAHLLDSLGWVRGTDGLRAKNGKQLAFTILIPTVNPNRIRAGVVLQDQ